MKQAELLAAITAIGSSPISGHTHPRKRSAHLSAVAEGSEPVVIPTIARSNVGVVAHPLAEHPSTSASPINHLDVHRPCTIAGNAIHFHKSLGSGIVPWSAVSSPVSLVC